MPGAVQVSSGELSTTANTYDDKEVRSLSCQPGVTERGFGRKEGFHETGRKYVAALTQFDKNLRDFADRAGCIAEQLRRTAADYDRMDGANRRSFTEMAT